MEEKRNSIYQNINDYTILSENSSYVSVNMLTHVKKIKFGISLGKVLFALSLGKRLPNVIIFA